MGILKTVISASRRTDIPAFYLPWFKEAIRAGFVETANPLYPKQIRTVDLSPQRVGWIVFWSRNYARFLKQPEFFSDYNLFFHFTILPQSKLETAAIPIKTALGQVERLSALYGPKRIIWRYDPLVFWEASGILKTNYAPAPFADLCTAMETNGIRRCYTSFAFPYRKFIQRFKTAFPEDQLVQPQRDRQKQTLQEMHNIAARHGIQLFSCSNDRLLQIPGIQKGHCIDGALLQRLKPEIKVSRAKAPTRSDCGCTKSIDIGNYANQPCPFGCIYCYANPILHNL